MHPEAQDDDGPCAPEGMLLRLGGYAPEAELHSPQDLDNYGARAILAVKNGSSTGTTFGRVNGLESVTRKYFKDGVFSTALELIVCGYDTKKGGNVRFSEVGDSGSFAVDKDGRLIGQLTGGRGLTNGTDISYITPYFALKKVLEQKFPSFHLLDDDA